ncbi:endonuclease/exonuclease/phosphatase family protein [Sphingobium sp.]|uniref:endonuclease/exonuclease/phosphatase family protein n=1 Tax=Sphingobium sp. TaxID=1912891 RepID=UPI002D0CEB40|nr:endonuclease/exonuclease/phosphatase family protein [Sphingobium sp.]HUD90657.1 endonuclease/exonuclease/phosphatase family protein [Sphingobium sp.]
MLVLLGAASGAQAPFLDLLSLVALPAAVMSIGSAAMLAARTARASHCALLLVAAVPGLMVLLPETRGTAHCSPSGERLRVAWLNVQRTDRSSAIMAWIERENPQVVGVGELDKNATHLRARLAARYRDRASCLANGRCSTVLYSRIAPVESRALARGDAENRRALSAVRMRLGYGDKGVNFPIVAVHLSRPFPLGRQRQELRDLGPFLLQSPDAIVIGDFNMSPRMSALRQFASQNGLRINAAGGPTWPVFGAWAGLWQIDHVLTGSDWAVTALRRSPDLGSDHRGLVADLCRVESAGEHRSR